MDLGSDVCSSDLLLDRPTFFLDVPHPFRKGLALSADYRFGPVMRNLDALVEKLGCYLGNPREFWRNCEHQHRDVKHKVYAGIADGTSSARSLDRLFGHLKLESPDSLPRTIR